MPLPATLKGFTAFADGEGLIGKLTSGTPPEVALKMEEFRDGGMDAGIELDMGTEKMEMTLGLAEYGIRTHTRFGLLNGPDKSYTLRGSQETEDGSLLPILYNVRGVTKKLTPGDWTAGGTNKAELKAVIAVRYLKITIGGQVVIEIDPVNVVRVIGGVDQLAARRQALGL